MATSVNYIQGNSLRIILPLMVIQLNEDGTTTEGSFVPLDGDTYVVTLKGQRQYRYTPTIEVVDGENCAVVALMGIENYGTYGIEIVVTRADGTRLRYANPDALTLEQYTGEVSGGTGGAPLVVGGVVLDASLFIFAKGDKGDDGEDGVGIASITKTGTSGLVDTYTITYTNGNTSTFTVTNGRDGTDGRDGVDGVGVQSIVQTTTSTESGGINVITCTLTNGNVSTFEIRNGKDGGGSSITIDHSPTQGSENAVSSGGVYDALQGKQDTLTFDNAPTQYSSNPVKSGGVYDALQTAYSAIVEVSWDDALQIYKSNTVRTNDLVEAYAHNQDIQLKFAGGEWNGVRLNLFGNDNNTFYFTGIINEFEYQATVAPSGNNPITVEIGYASLQTTLTFDNVPTNNSDNPVYSGGIYNTFATYCPIIEDTRSSAVADITGTAPFASLVDGQRILLRLAYYCASNPTLTLTLSNGATTSALAIYGQKAGSNVRPSAADMAAEAIYEMVYESANSRWEIVGKDVNTTYSGMTQAEIDAGSSTTARTITPKILCDNFQKIRTVKSEEVTSNAVTITLDATKYHVPDDEVDTITMNLPSSYTAADEFILCFTCNSSSCTVNLPTGVTLADNCDNFSEVAAGVFFQVSIMDNVAVYLCVTPTTP